jgi:FPC/CPF motif-containing protein YcgG
VQQLLGGDEADIEDPSTLLLPFEHDQQARPQLPQLQQHQDPQSRQQLKASPDNTRYAFARPAVAFYFSFCAACKDISRQKRGRSFVVVSSH